MEDDRVTFFGQFEIDVIGADSLIGKYLEIAIRRKETQAMQLGEDIAIRQIDVLQRRWSQCRLIVELEPITPAGWRIRQPLIDDDVRNGSERGGDVGCTGSRRV